MLSALTSDLEPTLFIFLCGVLGLLVGSFLNVVIHRLPKMMEVEWRTHCAELRGEMPADNEALSLLKPRWRCPACGHAITVIENICNYRYREYSSPELVVLARSLFSLPCADLSALPADPAACCVHLPRFILATPGLRQVRCC